MLVAVVGVNVAVLDHRGLCAECESLSDYLPHDPRVCLAVVVGQPPHCCWISEIDNVSRLIGERPASDDRPRACQWIR